MKQANPHNVPYLLKLQSVRTFVLDMDGVLTDGHLLITNSDTGGKADNWLRKMHVRDGYALQYASGMGYHIIVVSGSRSPAVEERLRKLGVRDIFFGITDKEAFLKDFFKKHSLSFDSAIYLGDDIPDLAAMQLCSVAACPRDAAEEILEIADYISPAGGGEGCVRDVIRKVMKIQGRWLSSGEIPST